MKRNEGLKFYYLEKGQAVGPVPLETIQERVKQRKLFAFDQIYREEDSKWRKVGEFTELTEALKGQETHVATEAQWVLLKKKSAERGKGYLQSGPFPTAVLQQQLASGAVAFTDYVWKKGMKEWCKISEVEEFLPKPKGIELPPAQILFETPPFPTESSNDLLRNVLKRSDLEKENEIVDLPPPEAGTQDLTQLQSEEAIEDFGKEEIVAEEDAKKIASSAPTPSQGSRKKVATSQPSSARSWKKHQVFLRMAGPGLFVFIVGAYFLTFHRAQITGWMASLRAERGEEAAEPTAPGAQQMPPIAYRSPVPSKPALPRPEPVKVETHGPTVLRVQLYDLRSENAKVVIETDATTPETKVDFLFTAESGEVVDRRSVHRSFRRVLENGRGEFSIRGFHLPDGSYFVRVQSEGIAFERAFFLGLQDAKFRERLRHHKKHLSFWHQSERQRLFQLVSHFYSDVQELDGKSASLAQTPGAWQNFSSGFKARLERLKTRELKPESALDNLCLWPLWIQLRELVQATEARVSQFDGFASSGGGRASARDLLDHVARLRVRVQRESLWR